MHSFGQEFYPLETIRALQLVARKRLSERGALLELIASSLPQQSAKTRRRIASKILQRYIVGKRKIIDPSPHEQPFIRLLTRLSNVGAQIELLYFELCGTDKIVGALARDLFYPTGIERCAPKGWKQNEFAVANGGLLPEIADLAPPLTRAFIVEYARAQWKFRDASSVDRALRVLQGAGLISQEKLVALRGHPSGFRVAAHDVSTETFLWALHREFLTADQVKQYSFNFSQLETASFARTLLLQPEQVRAHLEATRNRQFLVGRGEEMRLVFGNLDALTDALVGHS